MNNKISKSNSSIVWILLIVVVAGSFWLWRNLPSSEKLELEDVQLSDLKITKHAGCRMDCRQISKQEILQVLHQGRINKSKTRTDKRGTTYAYEGSTSDGQRVRVIVAPQSNQVTIVTVIDLDNEWDCNCN